MSSPELAYYDAGQSVNYDRKLIADGHEWISYLSYAGNRRYIPIREIVNVTSSPTGTIRIVNNDSETGTFDIIVSNVSDVNGVQKVSPQHGLKLMDKMILFGTLLLVNLMELIVNM